MTYELVGMNHKARVRIDGNDATLESYATEVAFLVDGVLYRADGQPQSNTTARHMREFAIQNGFPRMTKAELMKLPVKEA